MIDHKMSFDAWCEHITQCAKTVLGDTIDWRNVEFSYAERFNNEEPLADSIDALVEAAFSPLHKAYTAHKQRIWDEHRAAEAAKVEQAWNAACLEADISGVSVIIQMHPDHEGYINSMWPKGWDRGTAPYRVVREAWGDNRPFQVQRRHDDETIAKRKAAGWGSYEYEYETLHGKDAKIHHDSGNLAWTTTRTGAPRRFKTAEAAMKVAIKEYGKP